MRKQQIEQEKRKSLQKIDISKVKKKTVKERLALRKKRKKNPGEKEKEKEGEEEEAEEEEHEDQEKQQQKQLVVNIITVNKKSEEKIIIGPATEKTIHWK